jgi:hypothetical protein
MFALIIGIMSAFASVGFVEIVTFILHHLTQRDRDCIKVLGCLHVVSVLMVLLLCGCSGNTADVAGIREAMIGLSNTVEQVSKSVGDVRAQVASVDQSTSNYDAWALRIQAIGPWLLLGLPLPYVLGKLLWLASKKTTGAMLKPIVGSWDQGPVEPLARQRWRAGTPAPPLTPDSPSEG